LVYSRFAEKLMTLPTALEIIWVVPKLFSKQAKELTEAVKYDLVPEKPLLAKGRKEN
jgi:hypothetical protein